MNIKNYILYFGILSLLFFTACATKQTEEMPPIGIEEQESSMDAANNISEVNEELDSISLINNSINDQAKERVSTYILDELEFAIDDHNTEIIKLKTEIALLKEQLNSMKAFTDVWAEPLSLYSKKIVMNSGASLFGNIIYQDEETVHLETFIGTLTVPRQEIVRVIDNQIIQAQADNNVLAEVNTLQNSMINENSQFNSYVNSAKIILLGDFQESKDDNYNTLLMGQVKNIGSKRADFVKINFTIYKDKNLNSNSTAYTVFVDGATMQFDNNLTSTSSVPPEGIANFTLIIPSDFGPFTSYTYTIDWEQY